MYKRFGHYIGVDTPALLARQAELAWAIAHQSAAMLDTGQDDSDAIDGERDDCDELTRELKSRGLRPVPLAMGGGYAC
jgi:hypothetical protein